MKETTVLIIEDDNIYQKILSSAILNAGFKIAGCANSMDEALVLLDQAEFDIALVDIYLGDHSSGLTLGKLIRQKHHKPFIFISGTAEQNMLEAALDANCSCYLTKPFSIESLVQNIKNTLNQTENISKNQDQKSTDSSNTFFFAKSGKLLKRIEWNDVVCLKSDRNYTKVITKNGELFMIRCSLQIAFSHVIPIILQSNFVQINRAEVIQINYIKEFINSTVIVDNMEFTVSENYIKNLKSMLNIIL